MADTASAAAAGDPLADFKAGQRKPTPPPGAGDRVFYESLYRQRPSSFMALKWCVEHGVLEDEEVDAAVTQLEKRKAKLKQGNGSPNPPAKKKRKKQRSSLPVEAVGDAGMAMGGSEGIGTMSMG